jgi:hypothetical protein
MRPCAARGDGDVERPTAGPYRGPDCAGEAFRATGYLGQDALSIAGLVEGDRLVVTLSPMGEAEGRCLDGERELSGLHRRLRCAPPSNGPSIRTVA